ADRPEPAGIPVAQCDRAPVVRRPAHRPAVGEQGAAQARAPLDAGLGSNERVAPPRGRRRADGAAGFALVLGAERGGRARQTGTRALTEGRGRFVEVREVGGGCGGLLRASTTSPDLL